MDDATLKKIKSLESMVRSMADEIEELKEKVDNAKVVIPPFVVNGEGRENFIDLGDTPGSYAGQAGKFVAVNASGNGLIFIQSGSITNSFKVRVSETDTTPGPLIEKVNGGEIFEFSINNEGGDEELKLDFNLPVFAGYLFELFNKSLTGTLEGGISLVNDQETPGANKYYGTDASGVKGWYSS